MNSILFLLFCLNGQSGGVIEDTFDRVEINTCYNPSDGSLIIDQILFINTENGDDKVEGWCLLKNNRRTPTKEEIDKFRKDWVEKNGQVRYNVKGEAINPIPELHGIWIGCGKFNVSTTDYGVKILFKDHDIIRKIRAKTISHTYTPFDKEVYNRKFFCKESRIGLSRPINDQQ